MKIQIILLVLLLITSKSYASSIKNTSVKTPTIIVFGIPTHREDGTIFTYKELGHFNVYCGFTKGDYQKGIVINKPTTLTLRWYFDTKTITSILDSGNNYCVMTTSDTEGRESMYSNEINIIKTNGSIYPASFPVNLILKAN